jgi:O-antigen ligase
MKYAIFALTCLGLVPVAFWCAVSRRSFALMAVALFLPALVYQFTSINPISFEDYRGSARGYEISLIYLVALTILLTLFLRQKRISLFPDWGAKLYFAYFAWSCLSLQNAESTLYGGAEVLKMVMMFVIFVAAYNWLCATKDPKPILLGLAAVVVGSFFLVAKEHLSGVWQVKGPFPHQNSLALYMMMAAPVFFSYYLNAAKGAKSGWLFALAFFLGSGCLVRTYSRGAIAFYPVACGLVLFLSLWRDFKIRKILRLAPLAVLGLCGFLAILPRIIMRFENAPKSSGDTRIEFARVAVNMMKDKTFFGVGLNNWGIKVNPPYTYWVGTGRRERGGEGLGDPTFQDGIVETVYLLVGAECGVPGLVLMLCWYLYYLVSCLRLSKKLVGTPWFFLPVGIAGGLTGTFLQSALEWVLKQAVNFSEMMIFFAILSFLNAHWEDLVGDKSNAAKALPLPKRKRAVIPHHLQLDPVEHED